MLTLRKINGTHSVQKVIAVIFSILLIVLNVVRIFRISVTHDETGYRSEHSYLALMQDKIASANNHILHSLLRKFFIEAFADNLFFLRFDSLLAQVVFIIFSYRICRLLFTGRWWPLLVFILLNTVSPFVFDFWGLSRGYALGLSFVTLSVWFFLKYMSSKHVKQLCCLLFAAVLAVYSNFSFINYYVSVCAAVIIYRMLFGANINRKSLAQELLAITGFSTLLALMITGPIIYVYRNGEMGYLGNTGLVADTITSLVKDGLLLQNHPALVAGIVWAVVGITWVASIYWLLIYLRARRQCNFDLPTRSGIMLYMLLLVPCVSLVLQFLLFHINYHNYPKV